MVWKRIIFPEVVDTHCCIYKKIQGWEWRNSVCLCFFYPLIPPWLVLIVKEIHPNSDLHSGVVNFIYIFFYYYFSGAISPSFSSESLYLIFNGLCSLPSICPTTAQSHGCVSYLIHQILVHSQSLCCFSSMTDLQNSVLSSISCRSNFAADITLLSGFYSLNLRFLLSQSWGLALTHLSGCWLSWSLKSNWALQLFFYMLAQYVESLET